MKNNHIQEILDQHTFNELSEQDRAIVSVHVKDCLPCRQAYDAARLSSVLLKADSYALSPEPSAFFQAKVMNAWRERQLPRRPIAAFQRWWQAAAVPVFIMLTVMGVLLSLTFLAPHSGAEDSAEISSYSLYSTDAVVMHQKPPRDMTNEQVFQVIYAVKTDSKK